jgi:AcrR family transcriptional regulator
MGNPRSNETRRRIVDAARELFVKHGHDGVNMRELAERAGVNKGLLHYYFKTKDSIFKEVFQHQAGRLYTEVLDIVEGDGPFEGKVVAMVERYFVMLTEVPSLPVFVMFEVQRDPGMVARSPFRDTILRIAALIGPELRKRKLPPERTDGKQFLIDILSLCAFTFAMLPGISKVMKFTKAQRASFLEARKAHIIAVIQNSLIP